MEKSTRNLVIISSVLIVGSLIYYFLGRKKGQIEIESGEIKLGGKPIQLNDAQIEKIKEKGYSEEELQEMRDKGVGIFNPS